MVIKRVSYFSFLVALTAMATVSPCYASGEPSGSAINTAPRVINKSIATCFDKIVRAFDYSIGATRSFKEGTLKSGKLITAHTELRYETVRAQLKFPNHQTHSIHPSISLQMGSGDPILTAYVFHHSGNRGTQSPLDKRAGMAQKSRILLE